MEPLSIASVTLASILASLPADNEQVSQSVITTHISPAIAGQWELDLPRTAKMGDAVQEKLSSAETETESESGAQLSERRSYATIGDTKATVLPVTVKDQCRELYNFAADNEMWSVSGKEWTYGRYLVTHPDEGLPLIAIQTVYDNNEMDCSGNQVDQKGEAVIAYLKHTDNQMQWCADAEGTDCFMHFERILP
ncbi:hypothetical protein [Psychrobacter aestuarii]|uniref:Uncharacterized protein n=1 Tax=Psychrobacter aestuarii TaxID=556327 RepID=A0ABN0VPP9_9GAMM|nr:hypothetical protein [Psychrobacter aestuarii]